MRDGGGHLARFVQFKTEPGRAIGLPEGHSATEDARTLFPSRVETEAKRYLISGHNNAKIGREVLKGEWAGYPIFTLTLEERATCPRSCLQWRTCYGNAMPWPHRWDHRDPHFLDHLRAEAITLARQHPDGLVVRLHVLGDFYSMAYLRMWVELLDRFPQLHIYGYTARREDADDPESRAIAQGIRRVSEAAWDQFAIRLSRGEPGRDHSIVVDSDPGRPDVIVCPAQLEKTTTCGTCGLCWSPAARDRTIAFLRHGIKAGGQDVPTAKRAYRRREPKAVYHPRTGALLNPSVIGSAERLAKGTPEDRINAVSDEEKARIAAQYGATFKKESL